MRAPDDATASNTTKEHYDGVTEAGARSDRKVRAAVSSDQRVLRETKPPADCTVMSSPTMHRKILNLKFSQSSDGQTLDDYDSVCVNDVINSDNAQNDSSVIPDKTCADKTPGKQSADAAMAKASKTGGVSSGKNDKSSSDGKVGESCVKRRTKGLSYAV